MSAGSPFGLLAQAVRRACGIVAGEPGDVQRQRLRAHISRHLAKRDAARVCEFIGEMAAVPFPAEHSVQLAAARNDPMLMGDQIRAAWQDWLAAECAVQPVLLVLEDLHWGDLSTVTLTDFALRNLRDMPFVVLAFARPEVHTVFPNLWTGRSVTELRLGELGRRACERLVREVLGDTVDDETVQLVLSRAAGNAFYLEELIRAVAEGKGDALPETVLAMVQARLDSLQTEARRIMRAAAVFGRRFWRDGVCTLLGGGTASEQVDRCLEQLAPGWRLSAKATPGRSPNTLIAAGTRSGRWHGTAAPPSRHWRVTTSATPSRSPNADSNGAPPAKRWARCVCSRPKRTTGGPGSVTPSRARSRRFNCFPRAVGCGTGRWPRS
jgi:eukaryotic-like serine/threonine-protein kinase